MLISSNYALLESVTSLINIQDKGKQRSTRPACENSACQTKQLLLWRCQNRCWIVTPWLHKLSNHALSRASRPIHQQVVICIANFYFRSLLATITFFFAQHYLVSNVYISILNFNIRLNIYYACYLTERFSNSVFHAFIIRSCVIKLANTQ